MKDNGKIKTKIKHQMKPNKPKKKKEEKFSLNVNLAKNVNKIEHFTLRSRKFSNKNFKSNKTKRNETKLRQVTPCHAIPNHN